MLSACATAPEHISGSYISPTMYASYDCAQIGEEMQRVAYKVDEVTGQQHSKARNDELAMGVGLIPIWPALFFLASGSDHKAELQTLKGSYDALSQAAIQKHCSARPAQVSSETQAPAVASAAIVPAVVVVAAKTEPSAIGIGAGPTVVPGAASTKTACGMVPQLDGSVKLVRCR